MRGFRIAIAAGALLALCTGSSSQDRRVADAPAADETMNDLMHDVVEPSAYALWDATATLVDEEGAHNVYPRSAAEWRKLKRAAMALDKASVLMTRPGLKIVADSEMESAEGGTLDVDEIARRVAERPASFQRHATDLRQGTRRALQAIAARNVTALATAGTGIAEACEACHREFWYRHDPEKAS